MEYIITFFILNVVVYKCFLCGMHVLNDYIEIKKYQQKLTQFLNFVFFYSRQSLLALFFSKT